jgi:hypothetical protein
MSTPYPPSVGGTHVTEVVEPRNRVQWGPIIAGVLAALGTLLVLAILGLAVGASALEPRESGQSLGTTAAIYGAVTAIVAFFVGGFVAAKSAAVGGAGSGMLNGLMVGLAILALVIYLTGSGVGTLLGTVGSNLGDLVNVAQGQVSQSDVDEAQRQAQQADLNAAFDSVADGAWGTLIGLVLALAASTIGGIVGHNRPRDLA